MHYFHLVFFSHTTDRVVDEMNPDVHFSRGQLENLLKNEVQYMSCIIFDLHIKECNGL